MKKDLEIKTKQLRKRGYSIKELKAIIGVSKSTLSAWIQDVELSEKAKSRLRRNYTKGQIASQKTIAEQTRLKNLEASTFASTILPKAILNTNIQAIVCAMIYQCEGAKSIRSSITFTNSDPRLIASFLFLLRNSFNVNESRFRILMHLHKYHNENIQKEFWSTVTGIPKEQFQKTYLKPSSGKYKKEGYPGCIKVYYSDVSVARKLHSIAKTFMERYK